MEAQNPIWMKQFLQEHADDTEMTLKLISLYLERAPFLIAEIERTWARKDAAALIKSAHSLAGCTSVFAWQEAVEQMKTLEQYAHKENWSAIEEALPESKRMIFELVEALRCLGKKISLPKPP